jgi:hypothetical protein
MRRERAVVVDEQLLPNTVRVRVADDTSGILQARRRKPRQSGTLRFSDSEIRPA